MSQDQTIKAFSIIFGIIILATLARTITPPANFPVDKITTVEEGAGLQSVANKLQSEGAIRSSFWFRVSAIFLGGERDLKAGEYYLSRPQSPFFLAWRILHGDYDIDAIKITVPEGFTVKKISDLFDEKFKFFDHKEFEKRAPEGYLFPDTYFIPVTATASSTIKIMRENFIRKIFPVMPEVEKSGKELKDIIVMASIVEGEANKKEDREIISGILWKRLDTGMPLQVDASFVYVNGKGTADLTVDDLKIDSPYNTYLYKGLPPGPISNPGIESIKATLNPKKTQYLYFLTGKDGKMYYAKTFEEHVANKQKYL